MKHMTEMEPVTKDCRVCRKTKPLNDFYKKSASKDGHCAECRDCSKARVRAYARAVYRAQRRLIDAHRRQYDALLAQELREAP